MSNFNMLQPIYYKICKRLEVMNIEKAMVRYCSVYDTILNHNHKCMQENKAGVCVCVSQLLKSAPSVYGKSIWVTE